MKIIDLLNRIAKGEEVPKKIIYTDDDLCRYVFEKECNNDYWCEELGGWLFDNWDIQKILNDEIEIIEEVEDKEYKDIEELKIECMENQPSSKYIVDEYGKKCFLTKHSKIIADKVNELVRNQKYILERLDK